MHIPQSGSRRFLYMLTVRAVLENEGLYYDDLVDILAMNVNNEEALTLITRRRRRAVNETDQRAITSGKRAVARLYIDRARRNGRITFLDRPDTNESRTVWLGSPPTGGGPNGRTRSWDDERAATQSVASILHATRPELR